MTDTPKPLAAIRAKVAEIYTLVPRYPRIGGPGSGSTTEGALQDAWERRHGCHGDVLTKVFDAADAALRLIDAAVVADSPELAQARERIAALEFSLERAVKTDDDLTAALAKVAALEDERVHVKQVADTWQAVTDGLNARIAALEADTAGYRADLAALEVRHGRMVDAGVELGTALTEALRRGDAALARVRELEAELKQSGYALSPEDDARLLALGQQRRRDREAAAQPKPRDRPEWPVDDQALRMDAAEHQRELDEREAATRADERRRTERDIVAMLERSRAAERAVSQADKAMRTQYMHHRTGGAMDMLECIAKLVGESDYPRTDAPAPASVDDDPYESWGEDT